MCLYRIGGHGDLSCRRVRGEPPTTLPRGHCRGHLHHRRLRRRHRPLEVTNDDRRGSSGATLNGYPLSALSTTLGAPIASLSAPTIAVFLAPSPPPSPPPPPLPPPPSSAAVVIFGVVGGVVAALVAAGAIACALRRRRVQRIDGGHKEVARHRLPGRGTPAALTPCRQSWSSSPAAAWAFAGGRYSSPLHRRESVRTLVGPAAARATDEEAGTVRPATVKVALKAAGEDEVPPRSLSTASVVPALSLNLSELSDDGPKARQSHPRGRDSRGSGGSRREASGDRAGVRSGRLGEAGGRSKRGGGGGGGGGARYGGPGRSPPITATRRSERSDGGQCRRAGGPRESGSVHRTSARASARVSTRTPSPPPRRPTRRQARDGSHSASPSLHRRLHRPSAGGGFGGGGYYGRGGGGGGGWHAGMSSSRLEDIEQDGPSPYSRERAGRRHGRRGSCGDALTPSSFTHGQRWSNAPSHARAARDPSAGHDAARRALA